MKKLIASILAALTLCMAAMPAFAEEAPPVPEPAATGPILWYHVGTVLSAEDSAACAKIREVGGKMGYTSYISNLPTASAVYNAMPQSAISILHGHGGAGFFRLDAKTESGKPYQYISVYDNIANIHKNIYDYPDNELAGNSIVMFLSCDSAGFYSGTSLVQGALDRGAKCALGFQFSVEGAEDWAKLFMEYSHNRITIREAISQVKDNYEDIYGKHPNSPVGIANLVALGDLDQKLRIN